MTAEPIKITHNFNGFKMQVTCVFDPPDYSVGINGGWMIATATYLGRTYDRDALAEQFGWYAVDEAEEFAAEVAHERSGAAYDLGMQDTKEDM